MRTKTSKSRSAQTPELARILVPTDFSRDSGRALRYAVALARQVGGKITLLHVLEWPLLPAELGAIVTSDAKLQGVVRQRLDALAQTFVPAALLDKTLVRVGRAHRHVVEAARGLKMDLIIVATHGRTGLTRALLGSTAKRIVRQASCPVFTIPRLGAARAPGRKASSLAPRINRILVPVDFSPRSDAAVKLAIGLARTMRAKLALLHIAAPLPIQFSRFRAEMERYDAETKKAAHDKLKALAEIIPNDLKAETLVRQEISGQGIVAVARQWRADLIVLPTRGLTGAKYILLGSTAEYVVRHAACPVLTFGGASSK